MAEEGIVAVLEDSEESSCGLDWGLPAELDSAPWLFLFFFPILAEEGSEVEESSSELA